MIFGALVPVSIFFGLMRWSFNISLFGLETNNPLSFLGLLIIGVFALKAITSFGLWTEKDWAIDLGIVDALVGITICIAVMILTHSYEIEGLDKSYRIEPVFLLIFLYKLVKIKQSWKNLA